MTYTLEMLTSYVDTSIYRFDSTIEWAKNHCEEWTMVKKANWARDSIEQEYDRAYGAIQFASIYLKEISEEDADKLSDKLFEAKWDRFHNLDELIGC